MRKLAHKEFHWEGDHLIFQNKSVCYLVKDEDHKDHWHLKFAWRNEPTPEFFNRTNAMENARVYSLKHSQQSLYVAPLDALNG